MLDDYKLNARIGSLDLGGWDQVAADTCGVPLMTLDINDNLFSRGSGIFTELLTIPPLYRYGDRYQFDCSWNAQILSDSRGVISGVEMNTFCHELNVGNLLFSNMNHTLLLGAPTSLPCVPNVPPSGFPVILMSSYTQNIIRLSNLVSLSGEGSGPQGYTYINPTTGEFKGTLQNAEVMLFGTTVKAPLMFTQADIQMKSEACLYEKHNFQLTLEGSIENTWKELVFKVYGVYKGGSSVCDASGTDLESRITDATQRYLKRITKQAVVRRNVAEMALEKATDSLIVLELEINSTTNELDTLLFVKQDLNLELYRLYNRIRMLQENFTLVGEEASQLELNLNDQVCSIQDCPDKCNPGMVQSQCQKQTVVDIPGKCPSECSEVIEETKLLKETTVDCESWQRSSAVQRQCGCGNFLDCSCSLFPTAPACCCHDKCILKTYGKVSSTRFYPCEKDCIAEQRIVTRTDTCEVRSDCATKSRDTACIQKNAVCRTRRSEALRSAQNDVAFILNELDQAKKEQAAIETQQSNLAIQVREKEKELKKLKMNYDMLDLTVLEENLRKIVEENKALLDVASLLNTSGNSLFVITAIDFTVDISKDSPKEFPLQISFNIPAKLMTSTVTALFDFSNLEISLYSASTLIGQSILETFGHTRGRKKRQSAENFNENEFTNNCIALNNLITFFNSIHQSLTSLKNITDVEKATAALIASQLTEEKTTSFEIEDLQPSEDFNVTVSSEEISKMAHQDDELKALLELKNAIIKQIENVANASSNEVFLAWKSQVNSVLNQTGGSFSQVCHNLGDCFPVSIVDLEDVLDSAPSEIAQPFNDRIARAEKDLIEFSTSTDITIEEALYLLRNITELLADVADSNYWCAHPPNISASPNTNVTAMENSTVTLECGAESEFPITFQWKLDDSLLPLQSSSVLTIGSTTLSDTGFYTCEASNHIGTTKSSWTYLEIQQTPVFYFEPSDVSRVIGDLNDVMLVCNATASPNPQFRWYYKANGEANYTQVLNRTGNNFWIYSPMKEDEGFYRCEAWNSAGSSFSRPAYVSILNFTVSVMAIPLTFELESCTGENITEPEIWDTIKAILEKASLTADSVELQITKSDNITVASVILIAKNETSTEVFPETLEVISSRIAVSRQSLMKSYKVVLPDFQNPSSYENVCFVRDESEYKYIFRCPLGQELDTENNILCGK